MYNNLEQIFAFADSPVVLQPNIHHDINLYAYQQEQPIPKAAAGKSDTTLKFTSNLAGKTQDLLEPLTLNFNNPLKTLDSSRILLTDTLYKPIQNVHFSLDTTGKILTLLYNWQGSTDYRLLIPEGAASDTNNHHLLKNDTLVFKTKNESDYGSLKLNFTNLDKYKNPVLQLGTDKGSLESFPLTSNIFQKKLLAPGNYFILILEDKNRNGKWDPGDYNLRLQPEIVHRLTEPVNIRANWDNEKDVVL
jgi:hypothetical protein